MKVLRILVGLTLAFIVALVNGVAGIGYVLGGELETAMHATGMAAEDDPRLSVETSDDGKKKIQPKNAMSSISLIASTKMGAFGIFLQLFAWCQVTAGLLLVFKNKAGPLLAAFLGFVSAGTLAAEVMGATLTSYFGPVNLLGSIVAILVALVTWSMYRNAAGAEQQSA